VQVRLRHTSKTAEIILSGKFDRRNWLPFTPFIFRYGPLSKTHFVPIPNTTANLKPGMSPALNLGLTLYPTTNTTGLEYAASLFSRRSTMDHGPVLAIYSLPWLQQYLFIFCHCLVNQWMRCMPIVLMWQTLNRVTSLLTFAQRGQSSC